MKKIFEPGELELADLGGDPNRVVEIQNKVKLLLSGNRQRREEIKQEIAKEDAWALPGLINATYVYMNDFDDNPPLQNLISEMMASAAKDNISAHRLILQVGILENPFETPRKIALDALEKLPWKLNREDLDKTKRRIKSAEKIHDDLAVMDLYSVMLMTGKEDDLKEILSKCCEWIETAKAGDLLPRLTKAFPNEIETIITVICDDLRRKDEYRNGDIAEHLVESLRPVPPEWITNGLLIRTSIAVLKQGNPPRHTVIEYLWRDAIEDFYKVNHENHDYFETLASNIYTAGKDINDENVRKTLFRYWFLALGSLKDSYLHEIIYHAAADERNDKISDSWAIEATGELFFMGRNQKAQSYLQEVKENYPKRYEMAQEKYERMHGSSKTRGMDYSESGSGEFD